MFKCQHKSKYLTVYSPKVSKTKIDKDSTTHTFHLYCTNCCSKVDISCAVLEDLPKFMKEDKFPL